MIKITWIDGECDECGDKMLVSSVSIGTEMCKACQHIKVLERIAYCLEQHIGWN